MSRAVNTTISSQEPLQGSGGIFIAPFLVVIDGAWRFIFIFFFQRQRQNPASFWFSTRVSHRTRNAGSKTAELSKNAFKLLLTVASSDASCWHFGEVTACWALPAHAGQNPNPQDKTLQLGVPRHEEDISVRICCLSTEQQLLPATQSKALEEKAKSSPHRGLAPLLLPEWIGKCIPAG